MPSGHLLILPLVAVLAGVPPAAARANEPTAQAELRPLTAPALSAENEQKLRAAFDHLYNLEFSQGRQLFEQVARAEPESATARAFWASALLYEILAHQGSLQSQLFTTDNQFLKHSRLAPDPELEQRFHRVNDEAERLARRRLESDEQDIDALFALGLCYANRANYLAGVQEEYFSGIRAGEKAFDYHKKVLELQPEIHDARVVLGVHNYVVGSLSGWKRFLLFFTGTRGDRQRGLEHLRQAAEHGEFLRTYAKTLLVVANIREEKLDRALELGRELWKKYPGNPIFALEMAKLNRRLQRYSEATRLCGNLLAELMAHPHNPPLVGPEDVLLELGLTEDAQGNPERALETLGRVASLPRPNPRVAARAWLERGKIYDRLGERRKALAEYEKVIELAAYPEATRLAREYKDEPYRPEARR